jgi:hypothetical protein
MLKYNIINEMIKARRMRWVRACSTNAYRILVEKPETKRPLERP